MNSLYAMVVFLFLAALGLNGQDDAGSILGTVRDQSGSLVMGAKVTLRNEETSTITSTETSSQGRYQFGSIKAGVYSVGVESPGFQLSFQSKIRVDPRQQAVVDLALDPENPADKETLSSPGQRDPSLDSAGFYDVPQFRPGARKPPGLSGRPSLKAPTRTRITSS